MTVDNFNGLADWTWSIPEMPADSWLVSAIALIILIFFIWMIARLTSSANEDIDPAETDRQMLTAMNLELVGDNSFPPFCVGNGNIGRQKTTTRLAGA